MPWSSAAGRTLVLEVGEGRSAARLELAEVGGGIRALQAAGRDLIDGYGPAGRATAGRGQILAPWPNRLGDGAYHFDGVDQQLPITDVGGHTAMHGLVRWLPWTVADAPRTQVRLAPQPGWPTWLELSVDYELAVDALTVHVEARNAGQQPCPFGLGMHPYLVPATRQVAHCTLAVPATRRLVTDRRGLPVRWEEVAGSPYDFADARRIGGAVLDTCYQLGSEGFEITVDDLTLWADPAFGYAQVFTGDTDPDPARRRTVLAVEPMTCPPDAFRTGEALVRLAPGARWRGSWGLRWPIG